MSIDAVKQFHAELTAASNAGIPVQLGMGESSKSLASVLNEISSRLEHQVSSGQLLEDALAADEKISNSYRSALDIWLHCDGSPVALESLVAQASSQRQSRDILQLSILQPLVILAMGYFALIYICSFTIPKFESIYDQIGHTPGIGLSIMVGLRKAMIVWVLIAPLLLVFGLFYFRKRMRSQAIDDCMLAGFAQHQISDALETDQVAERLAHDAPMRFEEQSLSPLRKWAEEPQANSKFLTGETVRRLSIVSDLYRILATLRTQLLRAWLPPLALGLFGGLFVLGLGLSVFLPMIELLYDIAKSH